MSSVMEQWVYARLETLSLCNQTVNTSIGPWFVISRDPSGLGLSDVKSLL